MSGTIIIKTNLNHLYYTINIPDAQPTESEEDVHFKPLEHGSAVVHVNNGCYNVILADCDDVYGLDQWSEETCVDEGDTAVVTKFFSDSHGNAIHPIRTLNGTITIRTNLEGLYYTITDMHAPEGSANRYLKDQEYMQSTEVTITVPVGFYQVTLIDLDRYYGGLRWGEQHVVNGNAVVVVEKNYYDHVGGPLVPSKPIVPPYGDPPVPKPEPEPEPEPDLEWRPKPSMLMRLLTFVIEVFKKLVKKST
jgi:hypothetical protein